MTAGTFPSPFPIEDVDALRADEAAYGEVADAIRPLIDACIRTRVGHADLAEAAREIRGVTARLLREAQDEPLGLETASDGRFRDHANPMVGLRNPIAPPLQVVVGPDPTSSVDLASEGPTVHTEPFVLGPAFEGPPTCVHGGISASVLDQVLGTLPALLGRPGMTAYLNLDYRRPTPLGELRCRARVVEVDGWKTVATGELLDAEGQVTVEAKALFVVPRWARDYLGLPEGQTGDGEVPAGHDGSPS